MEVVYHGSSNSSLKVLNTHKSTHGNYLYATKNKIIAMHFGKRCGDDLTYAFGKFGTDTLTLVELIPGAFEKMYSNSLSIYTLPAETFKDIKTGFSEVVSEVDVEVIGEEYYENVFEKLKEYENQGLLKMYRYPNKPETLKENELIDKWRKYRSELNSTFSKNDFDRMAFLHPELLDELNKFIKECGIDYEYTEDSLIEVFKERVDRQLAKPEIEQYIDCAYISITNTFPNIKESIDKIYEEYKSNIMDNTRGLK